jgi:hypothetical protein
MATVAKMSSYVLREVDSDLWHRVKVKAANEKLSIKNVICILLADWTGTTLKAPKRRKR